MRRVVLSGLIVLAAGPAQGQEIVLSEGSPPVLTARPLGVYAGVEPGEAQPPPAYGRVTRRARIVTWPGFTALADGGSRFFVQTTAPVQPEVRAVQGRVEIVLPRTAIHVRNSGRWLETRFFNTPVQRARLERRRGGIALVLYMRASATPTVRAEAAPGGVFHYVYVDFAPGNYAPVAVDPAAVAIESDPPPAPARALDPSLDAMDDEAPPDVEP